MIVPISLKHTDEGVYYIHDYVPVRSFPYSSDDEVAFTRELWDYKKSEAEALDKYTKELMAAIAQLSFHVSDSKIGLVAVPPSKVGKESAIRTSIWTIKNWCDRGITQTVFGCDKQIYDYSFLLSRESDVATSHESQIRASYEDHIASISCSRDRLWRYRTTFIILDDVTTLGTSMDVCRDILIQNGANADHIIRLAIAKTK